MPHSELVTNARLGDISLSFPCQVVSLALLHQPLHSLSQARAVLGAAALDLPGTVPDQKEIEGLCNKGAVGKHSKRMSWLCIGLLPTIRVDDWSAHVMMANDGPDIDL